MIFNTLIIIFAISAADFVHSQCSFFRLGVSPKHQKEILNKHNYLRDLLSNGTVPGQPKATNLKPLRYDAKLAYTAQVAANTCKFSHYYPEDSRWTYTGQNLAKAGASFVNSEPEWDRVIQVWFDEYKIYHYPTKTDKTTTHYTQIASADTEYVGCGYSYFFDSGYKMPSFVKLYVCNYGPGLSGRKKPLYDNRYVKLKQSSYLSKISL